MARATLVAILSLALGALGPLAGCGPADGREAAPAATLGAVTALPSPAAEGSGEPNLAVARDGRVWLSWLEPTADGGHALRVASLDGEAWSTAHTVASGTNFFVNWADFPSVLPLDDGRLAAHWLQRSGTGRYAYDVRLAQSQDEGRTWSASVVPHSDGTQTEHGFASLWASGDSVRAVWLDGRETGGGHDAGGDHGGGGAMTLRTGALAPDGGAGPETLLDDRVCDCCQTTVAITSRGPVVLYRDRSDSEIRDISAVRLVNGRWSEPARVHADDWEIAACPVNGPAAAAIGERMVAAWFTGAQDTARVRVAFSSDAGATWSAAVRVDDGDPVGRVGAVLLDDGTALVSWLERTGGESAAVRVRTVTADGQLGAALTVAESRAARSSGFPRMARSGDRIVFAWTEAGTPSQIRVAESRISVAQPR